MNYYEVPHNQTFSYKIPVKILKGEEAENYKVFEVYNISGEIVDGIIHKEILV